MKKSIVLTALLALVSISASADLTTVSGSPFISQAYDTLAKYTPVREESGVSKVRVEEVSCDDNAANVIYGGGPVASPAECQAKSYPAGQAIAIRGDDAEAIVNALKIMGVKGSFDAKTGDTAYKTRAIDCSFRKLESGVLSYSCRYGFKQPQ